MAFPLGFGPLWGTPFPPPSTGPYDCSELCGFSSLEVQAISGCRGDILSKGTRPTNFVETAYCNHCGKKATIVTKKPKIAIKKRPSKHRKATVQATFFCLVLKKDVS